MSWLFPSCFLLEQMINFIVMVKHFLACSHLADVNKISPPRNENCYRQGSRVSSCFLIKFFNVSVSFIYYANYFSITDGWSLQFFIFSALNLAFDVISGCCRCVANITWNSLISSVLLLNNQFPDHVVLRLVRRPIYFKMLLQW